MSRISNDIVESLWVGCHNSDGCASVMSFPSALCCWDMDYNSNWLQKTAGVWDEMLQETTESLLEWYDTASKKIVKEKLVWCSRKLPEAVKPSLVRKTWRRIAGYQRSTWATSSIERMMNTAMRI